MKTAIVTGILVKNDKGEVLLVKKPDGVGPFAGTYLTPGGGIEEGESADDGVQRELYEETGVKAANIRRVLFDDAMTQNWKGEETHFVMLLYTGEYVSGDLKPKENNDDELEVVKWFSPSEVMKLPLSPPLQKLLAVIGKWKNKYIFNYGLYVPSNS